VILAGGHGSRLGGINKALIDVAGSTIIERTVAAISPLVGEVSLVVNDHQLDFLNLPLHFDPEPHAGVLPALLTGLQSTQADCCLLVACDMPFIKPAVVQHLFDRLGENDVCIPRVGEQLQPMLAVYRPARCAEAIRRSLGEGRMRMIAFLDRVAVVEEEEATLRTLDPELLSFFNVNEPADLDRARAVAAIEPPQR
jgi:molybdopterin-guanine dinucleotide biosynthesis protein A